MLFLHELITQNHNFRISYDTLPQHLSFLRPCLVPNKSPTYKSKSEKSDLFCQTDPTYKSPQLISHKLLHPNLKLISHPLLHGSHHLHDVDWCGKVCQVTYKSGDNQTGVTYKSLVLSHLTYKSGDLLEPNRP